MMGFRGKSVLKNMAWELGYYLIVVVLGFLAPRFIIMAYGDEVNGLSSTITQFLNVILLLQSGAATAAIYTLYQPIAKNDMETLAIKVASSEKFFKRIAYLFLVVMVAVAFIVSLLIKSELGWGNILIAFVIMGLKSFLDLYYTSKFRVVFTAFQQKFVLSIATLVEQVVYYLLVFLTIYYRWNFLLLYTWFLFGCIVKIVVLKCVYKKKFASVIPKIKGKIDSIIPGRNYSLANEISHSTVTSSTTIVLSLMYGLEEASVYAVYVLITSALELFSTAIYSAFAPSFASMCASENKERQKNIFSIFQFVFLFFSAFMMTCFTILAMPFIHIYTNGATNVNYVNSLLVCFLGGYGLVSSFRIPYNIVVSSFGLFKETWLQPVVSMIISLILSFAMGFIGYEYILLGPLSFYATNFIYQHFKLKKIAGHLISNKVFVFVILALSGLVLAIIVSGVINIKVGVVTWIIYALVTCIFVGLYFLLLTLIFARKEFKLTCNYIKTFIRKR